MLKSNLETMDTVLLIGASQRALVPSVIRAGREPICFDLFADWDTRQWHAESGRRPIHVRQIFGFQDLLKAELSGLSDLAVLGGGCELQREVVAAVEQHIPLAGCQSSVLREFHDQFEVLRQVRAAGFSVPFMTTDVRGVKRGFLEKPKRGCGGYRIQVVHDPMQRESMEPKPGTYFQSPIKGESFSSMFFTNRRRGPNEGSATVHLGVTKQLVGRSWLGASEFGYCGSVGPMNTADLGELHIVSATASVTAAADFIADRFGLNGVWGIDFVVEKSNREGQRPVAWIVDINPRIPASAELYELAIFRAAGVPIGVVPDLEFHPQRPKSTVDVHLRCGATEFKSNWKAVRERKGCSMEAKAVLFHRPADKTTPLVITDGVFRSLRESYDHSFFTFEDGSEKLGEDGFSLADIPHPGTVIKPEHPILTIRLRGGLNSVAGEDVIGGDVVQMETLLQKKAADVYRLLE